DTRERDERGHVEVAERGKHLDVRRRPDLSERRPRPRVGGEDDALAGAAEAVDDPREPLGPDVRLAVDRRRDVAPRLELVALEDGGALARDRREPEARVGHHVADDLDPAGDALSAEGLARALVGTEEE